MKRFIAKEWLFLLKYLVAPFIVGIAIFFVYDSLIRNRITPDFWIKAFEDTYPEWCDNVKFNQNLPIEQKLINHYRLYGRWDIPDKDSRQFYDVGIDKIADKIRRVPGKYSLYPSDFKQYALKTPFEDSFDALYRFQYVSFDTRKSWTEFFGYFTFVTPILVYVIAQLIRLTRWSIRTVNEKPEP